MMSNKKFSVFFKLMFLAFLLIGCNVTKTDNEGNEISEKDLKATSSAKEQKTLSLSIDNGRLILGTWQAIYLWEPRYESYIRKIHLHAIGDKS